MELPVVRWRMPAYGAIKVNVHGFFTENPFPNGNMTGIGVVIRSHRGKIHTLFAGSLRLKDQKVNELYAILEGLIKVYLDEFSVVELETDNVTTYWEWDNPLTHGVVPEHFYVIQQLNQRMTDENFMILTMRPIDEDSYALARYLARYGAEHWTQMVVMDGAFGRVFKIWNHDMGLGPVGAQFLPFQEKNVMAAVDNNVAVEEEARVINEVNELK